MKILQICHRVPYPAIDGGNIAMMNTAMALVDSGHDVHMFALNTKKHFVDIDSISEKLKEKLHFDSVRIDTSIKITGILFNLISSNSYNTSRFYDNNVEEQLVDVLRVNSFDIVQLETLFTAPYIDCIRKNSSAKIVLRAHNVEHIIWERLAKKEENIFRKHYFKFLASRLKKYELQAIKKIDALLPITSVDESSFRSFHFEGPMISVPVSIDMNDYKYSIDVNPETCLFHLGSMDWMPNREAVDWFLKYCWPKIHSLHPTLKLYLAGRSFPDEIVNAKYPNVICEGKIEDSNTYMKGKQIMIVPLHSGSGMRVKIIQGMAMGKTIISTTIGAEGIPAVDGQQILIADTPEEFVTTIGKCINDQQFCKQIGLNGKKFVEEHYSNISVGRQLGVFYKALLRTG